MKHATALLLLISAVGPASARDCLNTKDVRVTKLMAPVDGPVLSTFGPRTHPILGITRDHNGVDYKAAVGRPVRAAAAGLVLTIARDDTHRRHITLRHAGGFETMYAQLSAVSVRPGDCVTAGKIIGKSGGIADMSWLHFGVQIDGRWVDPEKYVVNSGRGRGPTQ